MYTTPTATGVGAQILHVVLSELRDAEPAALGIALSIVIASTPREVREVFEQHYAEDRLAADDVLATWRPK